VIKLVSTTGDFRWVRYADVVDVALASDSVEVLFRDGATRTLSDPDEETIEMVGNWGTLL